MRYIELSRSLEYRVLHLLLSLPQFLSPYQQLDQLGYPDYGLPMKLLGRLQRTRSLEYRVPHLCVSLPQFLSPYQHPLEMQS